jgi:hypothetical protein
MMTIGKRNFMESPQYINNRGISLAGRTPLGVAWVDADAHRTRRDCKTIKTIDHEFVSLQPHPFSVRPCIYSAEPDPRFNPYGGDSPWSLRAGAGTCPCKTTIQFLDLTRSRAGQDPRVRSDNYRINDERRR